MAGARTAATPGDRPPPPTGPTPRRVRVPGWLDLRLVLGLLLVLGSVLVGARLISAADATVRVWAAAGDLAAGTVLTAEDLVPVDVRLDTAAGAYLSSRTRPEGRTLSRAVRAGELVPRSAFDEPVPSVQLALPVQAGYVPPGLERGRLIDVYAVADPVVGAGAAAGSAVTPVVAQAPVLAVTGRPEGVLSTPTTTVQVVVSVPAGAAPDVLAAIGGRPLVVVVHTSVEAALSPDAADVVPSPPAAGNAPTVPTPVPTAALTPGPTADSVRPTG